MKYMRKMVPIISVIFIIFVLVPLITIIRDIRQFDRNTETSESSRYTSRNTYIRIAVLNGCGREGLATLFARRLRSAGFDVVNGQGGNADSFDFDVSVVLDRKGDKRKSRAVADELGIDMIVDQYSANPYIIEDIAVIIGRDWDSLNISKGEITD